MRQMFRLPLAISMAVLMGGPVLAGPVSAASPARAVAAAQTPAAPAFTGITWGLASIVHDPASGLPPEVNPDPAAYTVTFLADGALAVRIACNTGGSTWSADGETLVIGQIATTLMGCLEESPISATFGQALPAAVSWSMDENGWLLIHTATGETLAFTPLGPALP